MRKDLKYPEWAKVDNIRRCRAYEDELKRHREEYKKLKEDFKNSQEGFMDENIRKIVQEHTKVEELAYLQIFEATKVLSEQTVEVIKSVVEKEKKEKGYVSASTIKVVLQQTSMSLNKIKSVCDLPLYQQKHSKSSYNDYERLFSTLLEKVDITFALFAPVRCLTKRSLKFHKLQDKYKDAMFARLERLGLFEDAEYLEAYEIAFKNQIADKGLRV